MSNGGFTLIDAPILTPAACEGTTTLFETDYFGDTAYLTQSGQLYSEAAAMAFGKVYCFGPTFRAEKSKTRRHLTEFWMIEPEVAYADLDDVMAQIDLSRDSGNRVLDDRRERTFFRSGIAADHRCDTAENEQDQARVHGDCSTSWVSRSVQSFRQSCNV